MKSKVYFYNMRAGKAAESISKKVSMLFNKAKFKDIITEDKLTAIKIHFGEKGNNAFINPIYVRQIVDMIKKHGGKPFLTDSNTLYKGSRSNGVDHMVTAIENGFAYAVVNAPIIISDGIYSKDSVDVSINKKHFDTVKISSNIYRADSMVVMSHFKGHETAGFGGAIKNLAMGCAPAAGKQQQHSTSKPVVGKDCKACQMCLKNCPTDAITMVDGTAYINAEKCIGCGECVSMCTYNVIRPKWGTEMDAFIERMTEYAYGAWKTKEGKIGFINFVMNVTPLCDCVPWSDAPIVPDIGILASCDPVAIDQASYDLVNQQEGNPHSKIGDCERGLKSGEDKFKAMHPKTKGELQLIYGEELGLGSRDYELIC